MKKIIIMTFMLLISLTNVFSEDLVSQDLPSAVKSESLTLGLDSFLQSVINKNISVTINYVETSITGTLLEVYSDGIYVQTAFNNYIFIRKDSISYIRVSGNSKN